MNMKELLKATGQVSIEIFDPAGALKEKVHVPNLVVQDGRDYIASRMKDATVTAMSHMAVGEDNTSPSIGNSALGTEVGRVALDSTSVTDNIVTYQATFPAGTGTGALEEAGILNAATGGTMLCRTTFAVVNKAAADSMVITWAITIS